jgi:hypothetical protein
VCAQPMFKLQRQQQPPSEQRLGSAVPAAPALLPPAPAATLPPVASRSSHRGAVSTLYDDPYMPSLVPARGRDQIALAALASRAPRVAPSHLKLGPKGRHGFARSLVIYEIEL